MGCELWSEKLEIYLDGELPAEETRLLDRHVRECPACASDALSRVQLKRAVQVAGKRFTASAEFRRNLADDADRLGLESLQMNGE